MDFHKISEDKILRAYEDGEFENLPGFGKPLVLEDLSSIPEELRMAYKMLKNAGYSTEENKLKQELLSIEGLIKDSSDESERQQLKEKLNKTLLQFNRLLSNRRVNTNSSIFKSYEHKIYKKIL